MRQIKSTAGQEGYRWNWNELEYLAEVIKQSKDFTDVINIFIDLHTQKEISEIIRRAIIASYIIDGYTYEEIMDMSGASRNTIAKISQKMMRNKTALPEFINKVGSFKKFIIRKRKTKSRGNLIDNTINKKDILNIFKKL